MGRRSHSEGGGKRACPRKRRQAAPVASRAEAGPGGAVPGLAAGGVGGKCARACSAAAGETRGAGPRERGRGRAGPSGLGTRRQLAVAVGKSWQDGEGLRRGYRSPGQKRRPRFSFQRVLSGRGAAGDVPAQAGRSLSDRAGDARPPLSRTLRRLGPPSRNPPTPRRLRPLLSPSDPGNRAGEAATAEEEGAVWPPRRSQR